MENISLDYVLKVHPVILYQIVDAYERRNEDSHRVIGTLLGNVEKGVIEVTNSFSVLHKEYEDQVEADLGYAGELGELIKRVNPSENIVGWWATGSEVTNHSSVIHEYYSRECSNPVHLLLDTTLATSKMALKGFVCAPLGVPGGKMGWMFTRIEVELICYTPETVALNLCNKSISAQHRTNVQPMLDLVQVASTNRKLSKMMEKVVNYVDDVLSGRRQPNSAIGRSLFDLINSVPNMSHEQFSEMFNNNVKDLLMVTTLSQMLQTQLQLNEKLTLLTSI